MKFVCDRCNTRYSISDDKVRGKVLKIRCKTCGGLIPVNGKALDAPPPVDPDRTVMSAMPIPDLALREPEPPPPVPAADRTVMSAMPLPPDALPTPTPQVKIEWHVSVDGKAKGPLSIDRLIDEVAPLSATADIHLWNEEMDDWKPLPEVSGIWRLVQHRRKVLAAPPKPPRIPTPPPLPIPPPIPREAAKAAPGPARAKRSATPGNELLLKPVSGVIGGGRSPTEDQPTPVPVEPKVVPAPELVNAPRPSASRAAVRAAPLPSPDEYPPTPPPSVTAPARSTAHPFPAAVAPAPFGGALPPPEQPDSFAPAAFAPLPVAPTAVGAPAASEAMPALTPLFPEPQPARSEVTGSGLMPKARLIRRQRVMKYTIAFLVAIVIVCVVVAWNAIRNKEVRTVVVEKPAAERKLSPEELAERLAMVGGSEQPRTTPGQQPKPGQAPRPVVPKPVTPKPVAKPGTPAPSGPVDQAAAARFAQDDGLRLPAGGIAAGGAAARPSAAVSQDAIMRVVNSNKNGIKTCYQRALLRDKTLVQGKIGVRLAIGISGRVKSVSISGPPEFRLLEPCIKDVVQRWVFPASSDEYGAEFPFVFQGSE